MPASAQVDAVRRALAVVDEREAEVRAFVHLDRDRALAEAAAAPDGPLAGVVLGVKDVIDTGDQPTEYGTPIHAGHRPDRDAASVERLRAAGAVCLGKTVTAELACFTPGPTTNPHRATHTPGGSSSGSAAAVACGMVDLALGTQTAGSVIRPASFCGVYGFKPTFGLVPTDGVRLVAPSLDTVGWFARSVAEIGAALAVLAEAPVGTSAPPRIGLLRTAQWDDAAADSRAAVEEAARRAAVTVERPMDAPFASLAGVQPVIQQYEAALSLAWELHHHRDELSPGLVALLERGEALTDFDHRAAAAIAADALAHVDELFGECDVLLTPAAVGEAPAGLDQTGDPLFARAWSLLGAPALSVPGLVGATGLPIGVQLVGRPGADAAVLAAGASLGAMLAQ